MPCRMAALWLPHREALGVLLGSAGCSDPHSPLSAHASSHGCSQASEFSLSHRLFLHLSSFHLFSLSSSVRLRSPSYVLLNSDVLPPLCLPELGDWPLLSSAFIALHLVQLFLNSQHFSVELSVNSPSSSSSQVSSCQAHAELLNELSMSSW